MLSSPPLQLRVIRDIVQRRPRSTMLLVKGELGNVHDTRRLAVSYVDVRYCILADYDILWKEGMAAELLRVAKTLQPPPFIVLPAIDEIERVPGLRPEKWQAHGAVGEHDHKPVTLLHFRDQGPDLPLVVQEMPEAPDPRADKAGWGVAAHPGPTDPATAHTDLAEPHLMLLNLDMMREAGMSREQLWHTDLFARSFYSVSFNAIATFGYTAIATAFDALASFMLYPCWTSFSDIIMFIYRWDPVFNADYSQVRCRGGRAAGPRPSSVACS